MDGIPRFHIVSLAAMLEVALLFSGCSSSTPRFRTEPSVRQDEEAAHAARIREEETREDDRKVDIGRISKELTSRSRSNVRYSNKTPPGVDRDKFLLEIVSMLGVPYEFGGNSRKGVDCSAFTALVYRNATNRTLPRSTRDQYQIGTDVTKSRLAFGDLVFFNTTGASPSHVGIYIEDDLFAHASVSYGVTISSLESTYYRNRFVGGRRAVAGGGGTGD